MPETRRYLLLDANVTAAYYLARSLQSHKAQGRITNIIDSVRTGGSPHFLYIPNFCIAETFSVFMKYAFGKWNRHLKNKKTLDKRVYESLVTQFQDDIHNGRVINQYELSRYHILATNLVAPVDHYFQVTRGKHRYHKPMGTFDHLYVAMGIHLARIHGPATTVLLTTDSRIADIIGRCRSSIATNTVRKMKMHIAERVTGMAFGAELFPKCLDLKSATEADMKEAFGAWPLSVAVEPDVYRCEK